jgi:Helitron helicase-like domain at N-terminus
MDFSQRIRLQNRDRQERWRRRQSGQRFLLSQQEREEREERVRQQNLDRQREHRERARQQRREQLDTDELPARHDCGLMNTICNKCQSKNFAKEKPRDGKFNSCCRKGKIAISQTEPAYPSILRDLMSNVDNPDYRLFRENIRAINSSLSFASMGAQIANVPGTGPYCFKIQGQIYHMTSHINPNDGEIPQFAQLYVMDTTQAVAERMAHPQNTRISAYIIRQLDELLRRINPFAQAYRMMREIMEEERLLAERDNRSLPVVNMALFRDRRSDARRYNEPTANEVAMVFRSDDGEPPFERDLRIYPRAEPSIMRLNVLSPNLDPMTYAILYPFGQRGWQPNIPYDNVQREPEQRTTENDDEPEDNDERTDTEGIVRRLAGRRHITMLQHKVSQTAIRPNFNPIISAGKLFQQWAVDSYVQVEANNLNFIRNNQSQLRTENYRGLMDHLANVAANEDVLPGRTVILPSTFQGSPRNMRERYQDAMAIVSKFGPPDLFVTFTCNPAWPEIVNNLQAGEQSSDRPDLVARIFKLKLAEMINDLTVVGVLGVSIAFVYTIEFQKRGLPHAHILIILREEDKPKTPAQVDQIVSAELPDQMSSPRLYEIVTRSMVHGPCGELQPNAPCMVDGCCSKKFPKDFQNETIVNPNGYPIYQRQEGPTAVVRGKVIDNR